MFDDLHNSDEGRSHETGRRQPPRSGDTVRPMSDREVPLGQRDGMALTLHAWLDGELPEAAVRKGDTARDAEMWRRINYEATQLRHMRTPVGLADSVMAALPQTAPQLITPWYQREFVLTPATVLAGGVALAAVAATATAVVIAALR
jgi:anti-sigma factor RsiW